MATTFPTSLQDLDATRGTTGQPLSSPNHITHHLTEDDTIEALQAKVGINSSAVTTSHDYKLSGVTGSDKAASLTASETLTNKNLGTGTKITLGSDATGDIWYRHTDGTIKKLAAVEGKILKIVSGIPSWETEITVADASTTAKGVVEEATLAEIDANTAAGSTSARLFVNPSTLGKSTDGTMADNSDAKIPSQKAVRTYVGTMTAGRWVLDSTTTFSNDASKTITLASSYSVVMIVFTLVGSGATSNQQIAIQTNGDTGANYNYNTISNSAVASATSQNYFKVVQTSGMTSGIYYIDSGGASTGRVLWGNASNFNDVSAAVMVRGYHNYNGAISSITFYNAGTGGGTPVLNGTVKIYGLTY